MKNTTLWKIVKYWNELSYQEKLDLLQKFEVENSEIQKRAPRELVVNKELEANVGGLFSYNTPDVIFPPHPTLFDGIDMANSTAHEGYHAYIYDHLNDKCDLNLYSDINIEEFYKEKGYDLRLHSLCQACEDGDLLFSLYGQEECLVRKETALHLIYNLIKSCENKSDIIKMAEFHTRILDDETRPEKEKLHLNKLIKFCALKSICEEVFKNSLHLYNTTKKVNKNSCPALVKHFDENLKIFMLVSQYPDSVNQVKLGMQVGQNLLNLYDELEMGQ